MRFQTVIWWKIVTTEKIEKYFCNQCKSKTKHFVRGEYQTTENDELEVTTYTQRALIIECCGCEHIALVMRTHFSENVDYFAHPTTGQLVYEANWDEVIYPPVTNRTPPSWFDDLPDPTLKAVSQEIYKSLQTESHFLAAFGSRTLVDRLIVLTVGDKGNFQKGLRALQDEGKISKLEGEVLQPVIDAGNAAAHRGWAPSKDQLATILDTVEGLIHRLLVLPKLAEELEEAVPSRGKTAKAEVTISVISARDKIKTAPKDLVALYNELVEQLKGLGDDVSERPQKHYIAFRRNRNFACVQIYNQKKLIRVYLNIDPDSVEIDESYMRDVRQVGHFGTGDLEITIKTKKDIERAMLHFDESYRAS